MKFLFCIAASLFVPLTVLSAEKLTLLFEDDFERNESDDSKEEIGKNWKSNSKSWAKGKKQVDLKNGALHVTRHPEAGHAVGVKQPINFKDGKVMLRFKLPTEKDSLGLNFADMECKEVHAGHLCMTTINTKTARIRDLKTGRMMNQVQEAYKSKTMTKKQKKMLQMKSKRVENKLVAEKWYDLAVTIKGDAMTVAIDGAEVVSFTSKGIGHPTKRLLRISVAKQAIIDDVKIYALR